MPGHRLRGQDGEVIIVDEFTGRLMYGRHFSRPAPGHRAEAGRGVTVARDKTLATITFQNYFACTASSPA